MTACLTSSMLSNSFGSWAAVTSRSSGVAELVAGAGGDVATVADRSGSLPTTAQITSATTAMRMNAYDNVSPMSARSLAPLPGAPDLGQPEMAEHRAHGREEEREYHRQGGEGIRLLT